MAKKKATRQTAGSTSDDQAAPDIEQIEERLRLAREELRAARQSYETAKAVEQAESSEAGSIRDLLDGGLEFVAKYPALGVVAATMFGVFLGRLFRR